MNCFPKEGFFKKFRPLVTLNCISDPCCMPLSEFHVLTREKQAEEVRQGGKV